MENVSAFTSAPTNYASFGRRFVALIIDALVLGLVIGPIMAIIGVGAMSGVDTSNLEDMSDAEATGMAGGIMAMSFGFQLVLIVVQGVYFVLMESSAKQGTLGKMAMGIKVTDMNGNRITTKMAIFRFIGRIVSGAILMIGYLMAAFTDKKQALHDMIANTLVLKG
jgi:uncharacterized RDD family membrane protein YckC